MGSPTLKPEAALYYRLNVFPIALPTLADRREAILPLAELFASKFAGSFGKKITGFTDAAKSALLAYEWPGNIRELKNVIERAIILSGGEIGVHHLKLEQLRWSCLGSVFLGILLGVESTIFAAWETGARIRFDSNVNLAVNRSSPTSRMTSRS